MWVHQSGGIDCLQGDVYSVPCVSCNGSGENKAECDHCHDNPNRLCKHCSCSVCGDKREPDKQLMCDECDAAYHIYCLQPPLSEIPDVDEWSVNLFLFSSVLVGIGKSQPKSASVGCRCHSLNLSDSDADLLYTYSGLLLFMLL